MDGVVGRGTLLAGRYRTVQPVVSDLPGAASWDAIDQILDRPVRVTILHGGEVPQALDAARRAALVTDPRLVRVLDVGEHEGVAYTVTEQVSGLSLAELAARGPLPADQARAVVGEAAAALEAARRRGVHHLALRPSAIHLTPDDRVLVTGLAVDGALVGRDGVAAAEASRADTVALVGLLYAALTGRWPSSVPTVLANGLGSGGRGMHLPAAPELGGAPVPPAELTSGVPNDLDTLCAVTLGVHDDGPHTPAELVQELEPWGDIRATDLFAATQALPAVAPATAPLPAVAATPAAPPRVQRTSVRTAFAGQPPTASRPGTPPPAVPTRSSAFTGPAVGQGTPVLGTAGGAVAGARGPANAAGATAIGAAAAGAAGAGPAAGAAAATSGADRSGATSPTPTQAPPTQALPTQALPPAAVPPAPTATPPAERTPVTAGDAVPTTVTPTTASTAASARTVAVPRTDAAVPPSPMPTDPSPTSSPTSVASAPGAPPSPVRTSVFPMPGDGPRDEDGPAPDRTDGDEPPGARETIAAHRFDPTKLVLLVVAVAIVVGLFAAYRSLSRPVDLTGDAPAAEVAESAPAQPDEPAPAPEAPAPAPDATAAPVIASAAQLDPPPGGDENEHPEAVPLAIDGDLTTAWFTRTYNRPDFGGLKPGVGYALTLAQPATVTTVTLDVLGSGGHVEVRATDPATPMQGDVLAQGPLGPQTVLTLAQPTETQSVVLWFTQLPQAADGANRLELAEVTLS